MTVPGTSREKVEIFFDVISPFSYILDAVLRVEPLGCDISLRPVLFAGLLQAYGNKGPAEIEPKRIFTYEYCTWLAHSRRIPMRAPAVHPFNPLRYLRLILACGCDQAVTSTVFDALWTSGADPRQEETWCSLLEALGLPEIQSRIDAQEVKDGLRRNTDEAIERGVFGVPTMICREKLFWGVDSLPMLRAFLDGDAVFSSEEMRAARTARVGAIRSFRDQ